MSKKMKNHSPPLNEIKDFFYGKVWTTEKFNNMLLFLYDQNENTKLLDKFNSEIISIISSLKGEIEIIKEKQGDLNDDLKEDLTNRQNEYSKKLEDWLKPSIKTIIEYLWSGYENNLKYYELYIEELKNSLESLDSEVSNVVIYEAPPCVGSYILSCGSGKEEYSKISTYWKPIEAVLSNFDVNKTPSQNMAIDQIGFIDLILIPLPLKQIREEWSTSDKFNIYGKQLPVWLFEWAIEDFITRINKKIVKKPQIAIGIPNKTSVSIFDCYAKLPKSKRTLQGKVIIDINKPNTKKTKELYDETGLNKVNLRLYKSNVTSGMGFPNGLLMKLALGINLPVKNKNHFFLPKLYPNFVAWVKKVGKKT